MDPLDENGVNLHEHQSRAGRVGGMSRSEAKRSAVRANLAKARAKRWPGREVTAMTRLEASNGGIGPQAGRAEERLGDESSRGSIEIQGPSGERTGRDQRDNWSSEQEDGISNLSGHSISCDEDVRSISNEGGE